METTLARRERLLGRHVPTFHDPPLHLVRGEGVHVWDADGRRYLDAYNNVPHVGHCHPEVVAAIARQSATLNVHTRYLDDGLLDYVEALTATLGHGLSQALMTCTGSEANDVALRMARAATGRMGVIATDTTYHGNTDATSQLSTRRPPVGPRADHVRLVPPPGAETTPDAFAAAISRAADDLTAAGHGLSALILCPILANEGLPTLAPGALVPAAAAARRAGGLLIADEVQPGFGRCGRWWGHAHAGLAPDIVTMGKSIANGYPAAALVTRPELMAAFRAAFGYFNTFAGNPVAAAAAHATLRVVERDGLVEHAAAMGRHAQARLAAIDHPAIAGIRGAGLSLVVDLAGDPALAEAVVEEMRRRGVLIGRIGPRMDMLKIRPPLPITADQIDLLADTLTASLAALAPA